MKQEEQRLTDANSDESEPSAASKPVSRRELLKIAGVAGAAVSLGAGLGGLVAACGEAEETTTTAAATTTTAAATTTTAGATTTTAAGETTTSVAAADVFDKMVDEKYATLTTLGDVVLPDEVLTSPKAVTGKKIVGIPILMGCDTCTMWAETVQSTSKILGWDCTIIDPQAEPTKIANALEQALTLKADGVATFVIDATTLLEPFRKLKAAGIFATSFAGLDAPDDLYISEGSPAATFDNDGYGTALGAYKLSGGNMKVLHCHYPAVDYSVKRLAGMKKFVAEAQAAGKAVEILGGIETTTAAESTEVPGKTAALVRQHPDYTVFWWGYDGMAVTGYSGLVPVGLDDASKVWVATDATSSFIELILKDTCFKASMGSPIRWGVYGQQNDLNRKFAGQEPLNGEVVGYPSRLIIKDNAPPSGEAWEDYMAAQLEAEYTKVWVG